MRDAKKVFSEKDTLPLVLEWQDTKSDRVLEKIFESCDNLIRALIFSRGIYQYMEIDEILSLIRFKIWRGLHLYSAVRGSLHNFLTRVIHNRITQIQIDTKKVIKHESLNDEEGEYAASTYPEDNHGIEDLSHRIMKVQTICTDERELEAQRWLVKSFIKSEFDIRRHHAANAMTRVYGINKSRSRELHDYTLLEIRRCLVESIRIPHVELDQLCGTRQKALAKYWYILGEDEFDEIVFLMKNLSSSLVSDVFHVLYGFPGARLLFY